MSVGDGIERRYSLSEKLFWLILARLVVAIILVCARVFWMQSSSRQAWLQVLPALSVVCVLTVVYLVAHRFSGKFLLQARIQFLIDIVLVTSLVWTTNVIYSPYIALLHSYHCCFRSFSWPKGHNRHISCLRRGFYDQRTCDSYRLWRQ